MRGCSPRSVNWRCAARSSAGSGPATTSAARPARASGFQRPLVGELTLDCESLTVNSAPGRQLVVHQADQGGPSERALSLLAGLAADARSPARTHTPEGTDVVRITSPRLCN
ncbi:hypothetical protein [Streptomyces canus]|uniref:MmyB family transcriptional regulator n=1 Tax=Streptomyces canus TaxID=58343 RepID=UPI0030E447DE